MFKKQMKFQKILLLLSLILGAVMFVYSIGFMTDVAELYQYTDSETMWYIEGTDSVFYGLQDYNTSLLIVSIVLILSVLINYITCTNTRRKYYIGNYITIGIQVLAFIIVGAYILMNNPSCKLLYLYGFDWDELYFMIEMFEFTPITPSTFFFDAGIVIAILLILDGVMLVLNLIWKILLMKHEKELLMGAQDGNE